MVPHYLFIAHLLALTQHELCIIILYGTFFVPILTYNILLILKVKIAFLAYGGASVMLTFADKFKIAELLRYFVDWVPN